MASLKQLGKHAFYGVPIYRQISYRAISFRDVRSNSIHYVRLNKDLDIPFYVGLRRSRRLRVIFHGAITRGRDNLPRFDRISTSLQSGDAFVSFADPTLSLNDSLELGWYLGLRSCDPTLAICQIISRVARQVGAEEIVLIGGSGGGHAALRVGAAMNSVNVNCFVFSPQTEIAQYHQRLVREFCVASGYGGGSNGLSRMKSNLGSRQDLKLLYENSYPRNKVYYFQNQNDPFHVRHHYEPFVKAMERAAFRGCVAPNQFVHALVDSVEGHGAPLPREFAEHFDKALSFFASQ